jgi:hypothetical protein
MYPLGIDWVVPPHHERAMLGYKSRARMALIPGTKLGPYEIQSPPGAGGMGKVYRAGDARLDRTVAVKMNQPASLGRRGFVGPLISR